MNMRDNKCGFVIARKEVLEDVLAHRYRYRYFQTFITVSATAKGYTTRSIETLFESRLLGESFLARFPARVVLWSFVDLAEGLRRVPAARARRRTSWRTSWPRTRRRGACPRSASGAGSGWRRSSSACRCTSG